MNKISNNNSGSLKLFSIAELYNKMYELPVHERGHIAQEIRVKIAEQERARGSFKI